MQKRFDENFNKCMKFPNKFDEIKKEIWWNLRKNERDIKKQKIIKKKKDWPNFELIHKIEEEIEPTF